MFQVLKYGFLLPVVASASLLFGLRPAHADDTTAPRRLRVMSYNIHHGRGTDNRIDLERVAAVIRKAEPDLVALQEVDIKTSRSSGIDQLAEIARLTKMHGRFGKGRDFEGGDYGQAILSGRPIQAVDVHVLPGSSPGEERIAVAAQIAAQGLMPELLFVSTHLHHLQESHRLAQGKRLLGILEKRKQPLVILAGDFNAIPGSEAMKLMLKDWNDTKPGDEPTYPSEKPVKKLDWILIPEGSPWRVVSAQVINETEASDHRPVLVELEWTGQDAGSPSR